MKKILELIPNLDPGEMGMLNQILEGKDDEYITQFAIQFRARRKDPQIILLLALVGFVGFAGLHRFILGHIGLGVLYLLTGGLCLVGTIIDLVNYRNLAVEENVKIAREVDMMLSD